MKANGNLVKAENDVINAIWEALDKCEDGDLVRKAAVILGDNHPAVKAYRKAIKGAYAASAEHSDLFASLK